MMCFPLRSEVNSPQPRRAGEVSLAVRQLAATQQLGSRQFGNSRVALEGENLGPSLPWKGTN